MVWLAVSACTLIVIMFLYNWINKSESLPRGEKDQAVLKDVKMDRNDETVTDQASYQNETSTMSSQSATIITISEPEPEPEQPLKDNAEESATHPDSKQKVADARIMPPPPVPAPAPAPATSMPSTFSTTATPTKRSSSPPRLKPPTFGARPPTLRPNTDTLRTPLSAAASLRVPPTKALPNASMAPSALMPPPQKKSRQVTLEPGHSPLDWAALTANPNNRLRGKDAPSHLLRITPSQLKLQNGRKGTDAWTVFQGKVYNITPYVPFHPGGKGEILRGAGRDSAKLFMEVHPWVNWDGMLGECCVGILVGEDEAHGGRGNALDEMD